MADNYKGAKSVYDFKAKTIEGEEVSLEKYKGLVLIITNIATKCGLTASNYPQLVQLQDKYKEQGLRILAFPCNQFGNQEPGSSDDICQFAKKEKATFDIFEKINVNGNDAHPLWKFLKMKQGGTLGDFIKWNYTKFLIDREGNPVKRYGPNTNPQDISKDIEKYL